MSRRITVHLSGSVHLLRNAYRLQELIWTEKSKSIHEREREQKPTLVVEDWLPSNCLVLILPSLQTGLTVWRGLAEVHSLLVLPGGHTGKQGV
jgi:hypothetical protein